MTLPAGVHFFGPTLPLHVLCSDIPGPTALIQACIHGDEVAGAHALYEMLEDGLRPDAGKLIVVPVMNPPAYRARQRTRPGGLDLNRCFPGDGDAHACPELRLARRFFDLVCDERPAVVATLHESHGRYGLGESKPSFGQTIVYGVEPMPPIVGRLVETLNSELTADEEQFCPLHYPVATSSTEVIVDAVGCVGLCIETWMGFTERRRIEMHKRIVELLLVDFGIVAPE